MIEAKIQGTGNDTYSTEIQMRGHPVFVGREYVNLLITLTRELDKIKAGFGAICFDMVIRKLNDIYEKELSTNGKTDNRTP